MAVIQRRLWSLIGAVFAGLAAVLAFLGLSSHKANVSPTIDNRVQQVRSLNSSHPDRLSELNHLSSNSSDAGSSADIMHQDWNKWDNSPQK